MVWWMLAAWAVEPAYESLEASGWAEVAVRETELGVVKVLHKKVGEVDCLQGVTTTKVGIAALHGVVLDVASAPKWTENKLVMSDVLGGGGDQIDFAQMLDVPDWTLVADRYWVLRGTTLRGADGSVRFRWQRLDAGTAYPKVKEKALAYSSRAVEPPVNWGEWMFRPVGGSVEVAYRACSDVGGSLPTSIQRWVASRTLPDTVADMIREAAKR